MRRSTTLSAAAVLATLGLAAPVYAAPTYIAPSTIDRAVGLLPVDSVAVAAVDVGRIRMSPLWNPLVKQIMAQGSTKTQLDEVKTACGIDPLNDINGIAMGGKDVDGDHFAVIVTGNNLRESSIVACMKTGGSKLASVSYGGKDIYEQDGPSGTAFVFLDDHTWVVTGSEDWAKKVIDLNSGAGSSVAKNAQLMALIGALPADHGMFWGAGMLPASVVASVTDKGMKKLVTDIKGIYGTVDLSSGLSAQLSASCVSADEANQLVGLGQIGWTDGVAPNLEAAGLKSDKMAAFTATGTTATMTLKMSSDDLQTFIAAMAEMANGGGDTGDDSGDDSGDDDNTFDDDDDMPE
jgi:hypothetical protein